MPEADTDRKLQARTNRMLRSRIPSWIWDSVVSIVILNGKNVHQFATGILFQVAEYRFVVTAAHSIRIASAYGKSIGVTSGANSFTSITGDCVSTAPFQYGSVEDPFDIAVYRIPNELIPRFQSQRFIQLGDVSFDAPGSAVFVLCGYPGIWSVPSRHNDEKVTIKPLEYTAIQYGGSPKQIEGYQPRLHIILDANSEGTTLIDGSRGQFFKPNGSLAAFPRDMKGISGCPVWLIGDHRLPLTHWDNMPVRVVGIETCVYQETGVIRATKWIAVTTLIHEAFPELRSALTTSSGT